MRLSDFEMTKRSVVESNLDKTTVNDIQLDKA